MSKSKEELAASFIASPFIAIIKAGQMVSKTLGQVEENTRVDAVPQRQVSLHDPPAIRPTDPERFLIADKVFSKPCKTFTICFQQYNKLRIIRATARKDGITKELIFTPAIAAARGVVFDMQSAVEWVSEIGFKGVRPTNYLSSPSATHAAPAAVAAPSPLPPAFQEEAFRPQSAPTPEAPPPRQTPPPRQAPPPVAPTPQRRQNMASSPHVLQPGKGAKPPFEGVIVSMGSIERAGFNGKPGYTTYAITVRKKYSGIEQEFAGEHLAELASELDLETGNNIRIQLLGKARFTVDVRGKTEERTRNEYSIEVL